MKLKSQRHIYSMVVEWELICKISLYLVKNLVSDAHENGHKLKESVS